MEHSQTCSLGQVASTIGWDLQLGLLFGGNVKKKGAPRPEAGWGVPNAQTQEENGAGGFVKKKKDSLWPKMEKGWSRNYREKIDLTH